MLFVRTTVVFWATGNKVTTTRSTNSSTIVSSRGATDWQYA